MKVFGRAALGIWLLVAGYFGFLGLVTTPVEGDSLAYHLPVAKMIGEGKWLERSEYKLPWFYYPAMGETLLAGWMKLGLPANWFNLFGWVMLTGVVYGVGRRLGLKKGGATVAAATVAMWPSVVRLIPTQTVDIWLVVWWAAAVRELVRGRNLRRVGIYLGMLVGTKYAGGLFAVVLMIVFWPHFAGSYVRGKEKLKVVLTWLVPMMVVGGFWYVRNWLMTGNSVYPLAVDILGWRGEPGLVLFTGKPIWTLLAPGGFKLMTEALMSEYLIWAGLILVPIWVRNKWVLLGWLNFLIYLILPSRPENIISDLRYVYPAMVPLLISVWKRFEEQGRGELIMLAAVLGMAAEMTQLDFRPKLFVPLISISVLFLGYAKKPISGKMG